MKYNLNLERKSVSQNALKSMIHYLNFTIMLKNFITNIHSNFVPVVFSIILLQAAFVNKVVFMESNRW